MAEEQTENLNSNSNNFLTKLNNLSIVKKSILGGGIAAITLSTLAMFYVANKPNYKILYSNVSEKDGGDITAALESQQIPYQVKSNGTILIPEEQVNNTRLKLASQGLPRGGAVGFELLENQKYGVSQFVEQVNYQRGLEGELAKTIQSISAVQGARVHIAIPKQSLFAYNSDESPTASVFLNLYPGKSLNDTQIAGIIHLVASSVPKLDYKKISIVDQNGALLSENKTASNNTFNNNQIEYIRNVEQKLISNLDNILIPMLGKDNYKVQISATIDFSQEEKTEEIFKPNENPGSAAIRSKQNNENLNINTTGNNPGGVPGTLVNKPPELAVATPSSEVNNQANGNNTAKANEIGNINVAGIQTNINDSGPVTSMKNSIINYEVDKTIRHVKSATGNVVKLTAAIILNNKKEKDESGKEIVKEMTESELKKIESLVKNAIGFNEERGDSLSVVNTNFAPIEEVKTVEIPVWKDPENIDYAKDLGKYGIFFLFLLFVWFKMLSPIIKSLEKDDKGNKNKSVDESEDENGNIIQNIAKRTNFEEQDTKVEIDEYSVVMEKAKTMANSDPKAVASLLKDWIGGNGK